MTKCPTASVLGVSNEIPLEKIRSESEEKNERENLLQNYEETEMIVDEFQVTENVKKLDTSPKFQTDTNTSH